jgi:hypothetical protein
MIQIKTVTQLLSSMVNSHLASLSAKRTCPLNGRLWFLCPVLKKLKGYLLLLMTLTNHYCAAGFGEELQNNSGSNGPAVLLTQ